MERSDRPTELEKQVGKAQLEDGHAKATIAPSARGPGGGGGVRAVERFRGTAFSLSVLSFVSITFEQSVG